MCTVLLRPGGNPIAVKYTISYHIISYIISYHIISYHIISYHTITYHIISYYMLWYPLPALFSIKHFSGLETELQSPISGPPLHSLSETKSPFLELRSEIKTIQYEVNSPRETEISWIQLNTNIVMLTYVQFWIRK